MKKLLPVLMGIALLLMSSTEGWSADFKKGLDAAKRGDFATALREWEPLAKQGLALAQGNLGLMYAKGNGVPQNHKTAVKWFTLAAEQGDARAQYNLARMYGKGKGVPQNYKTALKWYRLSANQGNQRAQNKLGFYYNEGHGVPQNSETAMKWYRLSANQGNPAAQNNLGEHYEKGDGVPQNYKTALKWYKLAYDQNYGGSKKFREYATTKFGYKLLLEKIAQLEKGQKQKPTVTAKKTTTYNPEHLKRLMETKNCPDCNLRGVKLRGVTLQNANLQDANLQGANLREANLQDANLQGANLREANLQDANLQGANLREANLYAANLNRVELTRAKLQGVNLDGAYLKGAQLDAEGVKIAKASGGLHVPEPVVVVEKTPKVTPKRKPKPPVVAKVTPKKTKPKPPAQSGSGSGFFVSRFGHVITNEHVVRDCKSVTVGDNAKKQSPVTVEEIDRRNDLALLKLSTLTMASAETKSLIRKLGVKVVPLASDGLLRSEDVQLGEEVMVAGYPYGDIFSNTIKVTGGMVSAVRGMGDDFGQFQLDAAVQPGNSGGPIYDIKGNIVGVVVAQLNKLKVAKRIGSLPENVNFGIKASTVRQFLTATGLPSKWSRRSKSMSKIELAKIAQKQTLMVICQQ